MSWDAKRGASCFHGIRSFAIVSAKRSYSAAFALWSISTVIGFLLFVYVLGEHAASLVDGEPDCSWVRHLHGIIAASPSIMPLK
jgi:hypothetical protein